MPPKRKTRRPTPILPRLVVFDPSGESRKAAAEIDHIVTGIGSVSGGIRYALMYTAAALKRLPAPPDMTKLSRDELITLCAHGDDWRTREAAALELVWRAEQAK